MNEGALSGELGLAGWPAVAEESIIARDVLLAEHVGSRLHVCHVSTAGSVEVIRWAKARGIDVTAEVTPHHLLLTEELVASYDPRFKVNPPLRRAEDVEALRAALADGTIDIVATDHAPHPVEAKESEWDAAANGMVGLESALSVVHAAVVENGLLDWADVARVLSARPGAHRPPRRPRAAPRRRGGGRGHALRPAAASEFSLDRLAGTQRELALPRHAACPAASSPRSTPATPRTSTARCAPPTRWPGSAADRMEAARG